MPAKEWSNFSAILLLEMAEGFGFEWLFLLPIQDTGSASGESNPGMKALNHTTCLWRSFSVMPGNKVYLYNERCRDKCI